MSATRVTSVHCDGCGEWSYGDGIVTSTAREIRRWLTRPGAGRWRCDKTGDWCPKCSAVTGEQAQP